MDDIDSNVIWAIQHVAFETLDGFAPVLEEAGYEIRYAHASDDLDVVNEGAGLVVLGGPIGANDERQYPYIADELRLIERWMQSDRPLLGICLGAQLIARLVGGRVGPGRAEIGISPLTLTSAGEKSVLAPFVEHPDTFHWHGDQIELPAGAELLAFTEHCPVQAFAVGTKTLGLQFHPETRMSNIEHWLLGHAVELQSRNVDVPSLRLDAHRSAHELENKTQQVARRWLADQFG